MIPSRLRRLVLAGAFLLTTTSVASASSITLNFEGLPDSEVLTTQFPGLVFSNALVVSAFLTTGGLLNDAEFPPRSGDNAVVDSGGDVVITFTQQVYSVEGYFTYVAPITLTAFDSANNPIGFVTSDFGLNYQSSGIGSPNELIAFNSTVGISSISLSAGFVLDDFTYDTQSPLGTVPDPASTFGLVILAAAGMLATRRRLFR